MNGTMLASIICTALGSGSLTAFVTWLIGRAERSDKIKIALRMCLCINLQTYGKDIINKGYCSSLEYKQFDEGYKAYKALGGDGYIDNIMQAVDTVNQKTIEGGMLQ